MASSRAALWAAAVDGGFSKGEALVSQMPDGKNPENPGFSWALEPKKTHLPGGFSERSEDLSLCPPQALKFLNSTLYVEISLGLPTREKP